MKPKPQRHRASWSATADRVVKRCYKVVRRALSAKSKEEDWVEKERLCYEIKCLVRANLHLPRPAIIVESLRKNASSLSFADIAERKKNIHDSTDDTSRLGDEMKPRDFTFFADKPATHNLVHLRRYTLPAEEIVYRHAIRRTKYGKDAGPDGFAMENSRHFGSLCRNALRALLGWS